MRFMKSELHSDCYQEGIIKYKEIAGFELSEITYAPHLELQRHFHKYAGFCLVLQGNYTEIYSGKVLACHPQTVTYSPAAEQHVNHFDSLGSHCFIVDISHQLLQRMHEQGLRLDRPEAFRGGPLSWLAARLYDEFKDMDEASEIAIEGLALEMMAQVSRSFARVLKGRPPRWLEKAREALHEQFSENLTLSYLAALVGVHPVYLASAFRQHYHSTVGDYVRKIRIEYACQQLMNSHSPLVEIALTSGFSSQSHFSRTFKSLTGMTPARYRATSHLS
jgi:AraC family transcriptional regulator